MKKSALIAVSTLTFLVAEAHAQGGMGGMGRPDGEKRPDFSTLDTDSNGSLSAAELSAFNADRAEAMMNRRDADEDGVLSEEEYNSRRKRGEGREGGRHKGDKAQDTES